MRSRSYLILLPQVLFCLSLSACSKNSNAPGGNPPIIKNVSWTELKQPNAKIIQKEIKNFQSYNLGNNRSLRILIPDFYEKDSVYIKLDIEVENDIGKIVAYYYGTEEENFKLLPENKIILVKTGVSRISLYAMNALQQKSDTLIVEGLSVNSDYKVLYMNDGQDISALNFKLLMENVIADSSTEKFIVVGIDASSNRLNEYGTTDTSGNTIICYSSIGQIGTKSKEYSKFVTEELVPYINQNYRVKTEPENTSFMGSSLGGLSAFNIAWMNPEIFGRIGVFSGSFWWRGNSGSNPSGEQINQARIMHKHVRESTQRVGMKFWFEAGTNDEADDRDKDGIIDAIDDTKDLMHELQVLGYKESTDYFYTEVAGGQHNQATWSTVLPDFLIWNYKK